MANNFWSKISKTAEDVATLEINTIIKSDMVCSKMPENDLVALYKLSKTYHTKIISLGNTYLKSIVELDKKQDLIMELEGQNLFRGKPEFQLAGYQSFRELSKMAKKSEDWVNSNRQYISISEDQIRMDTIILTRIEMQSYEICNILKNYKINEIFDKDENSVVKKFIEQTPIKLEFRHRQVIQKALDLGVERVVMQTRIGMDGDITTRISEKFAENPMEFVLKLHNESVNMSVSFWKTLFDTLVQFGQKILSKT